VSGRRTYANPVYTDPALGTIVTQSDFDAFTVDLNFADDQCRRNVPILIHQDPDVEFNEDIYCWLEPLDNNPPVNPYMASTTVTILYHDAPAGALDREWNPDAIAETTPPWNTTPGANNVVMALSVQPDGKTVLAGDFTAVNAVPRVRVARLNADGSLDTSFDPQLGADHSVNAMVLYPPTSTQAGKMLVAGSFTSFNGQQRNGIARLLPNGQLDTSLMPGNGVNGAIHGLALQADEKIVVVGDFSLFNDVPRNGIARLNPNGSLDPTYDPTPGANGIVWSVALTPVVAGAEKAVIAGDFTAVNGRTAVRVAQLNPDGTSDATFDAGTVDAPIFSVVVQRDGRILVGGDFRTINNISRVRLARLLPNGALDPSFDSQYGADDSIYTIALQEDGKPLIGGIFSAYNHTRRMGLARLRVDGTLDTSFLDTAYNQFAGLVNANSFSPPNYLKAIWPYATTNIEMITQTITNSGTNLDITITNVEIRPYVMIGGSFMGVGGNPSYKAPLRNNYTVFTRSDKRIRANVARLLGGVTPGPGNAEFDADSYPVVENMGFASVRMRRTDGRLGSLLGVAVTEPRTAVPGRDYVTSTNANAWIEGNTTQWSVGSVRPVFWNIPILDDALTTGNRQLDLQFLRAEGSLNLGGEYIPLGGALGRARALLTIAEDDFPAGEFNFLYANFITNENATYASITVIRTNGSVGKVSVLYMTEHSTTPVAATEGAGGDYEPASGRLDFASGQTTNSFTVRIIDDTVVEYDETIGLVLTNATGGAKLPGGFATSTARALLTIVDDDYPSGRLNFSSEVFTNSERVELAKITVTRTGGNYKQISVQFRTGDGTAASPADYLATNGLLQWDSGDSLPKSFMVRLIPDGEVRGPKTVKLELTNAVSGFMPDPVLLGARASATLVIADADAYGSLAFSQPYYQMDENAGTAHIIVLRSVGSAGTVTVNYAARPATAIPGVDFTPASGTLTLAPGQISSGFPVPLLDDQVSDGNKTVWLELTDSVNASLGPLSKVLLTIVDNESYNEPAGSLDTYFKADTEANGPVNALALQLDTNGVPDGRLLVAGDFTEINRNLRNRLARLLTNGTLDVTFDVGPGPNDSVRAVALQADSRILIGGFFTQVAGTNRNGLARLYADGTMDTSSFNPGSGADNPVYALQVLADGRILVAGAFSGINNIKRPGITRLLPDGMVDTSFVVGTGPNGPVYALALQSDGKIILGGDFTRVNGVPCGHLARLLPEGTLDTSFATGAGVDAAVWTLLVQPDGGIVVAGDFTSVNGLARSRLARIKPTGEVDPDFLDGLTGANGVIFALKQQTDGKLVVAGDFTRFHGVTRNRITRLNADGTTDFSINFGFGANGFIGALVIQPDRKIVLGGGFTAYDGQPRSRIARIHGGASAGNGSLEFSQPAFYVEETGTNALVTVRRRGGTEGTVGATLRTFNGTAIDGTDYTATTNVITFAPGEILQHVLVPVLVVGVPHEDRFFYVELGDFTGGAANGPQPRATVLIRNTKSLVSFGSDTLTVSENVASANAVITVTRAMATNMAVWVQFATTTNGTATPGADYMPTNGWLSFLPGETNQIFRVRILDDKMIEGNETFGLELTTTDTNVSIGPFGQTTMTLIDDDFGPGELTFSSPQYSVREDAAFVEVTVLRTNGSSGVIALNYATTDGTAIGGSDYAPMSGRLTFADGQTSQTVRLQILDDTLVEGDETFTFTISNPTGSAKISGSAMVTINIMDNEFGPGSLYAQFDAGQGMDANGLVRALALQTDGKFVIGGTFTNFNNRPHFYLARLNPDGSLDTNYNAQANALVTAIVPSLGNEMLIAGNFSQVNATNRNRVALVRDDGTSDRGFTASNAVDSAIYCLAAMPDGKFLLGGSFKLPVYGIARLLASGAMDVSFVPGVGTDGAVYALDLLDNGKILLGGGFAHVTGSPRGGVACLNEDGLLDEFYVPGAVSGGAASVYSLAKTPDGKVVIGGDFTAVGGVACPRLARLNADGSLDSGFAPSVIDGTVFAVAVQPDSKVVIGGAFTNVNGYARVRIARLNADGSLDPQFDPGRGADNTVYALKLLADGKVLLGGSFNTLNGAPRRGVAVLRGDLLAPKLLSQGYAPGNFLLRLQGEPGVRYALEASADLQTWTSLQTNTANSTTLDLTDPGAVMDQRFYRVRLVP
jgi:uncharacterized delta-60 repeat protein